MKKEQIEGTPEASKTTSSNGPTDEDQSTTESKKRPLLKRSIPWILTVLCVGYLIWSSDFAVVKKTLTGVSIPDLLLVFTVITAVTFVYDAYTIKLLFQRFHIKTTMNEALAFKGASYILKVFNYNAAAAGIALFFRNQKGVSLLAGLSTVLWLNVVDVIVLATFILVSVLLPWAPLSQGMSNVLLLMSLGLWLLLLGNLLYWRAGWNFFFFGKMRTWSIFQTFQDAKVKDYFVFIGMRAIFVVFLILAYIWMLPLFGIHIPTGRLIYYVPVMLFIGAIPLTNLAGLGTVQIVMREFFEPFTSMGASQVDAFSTTFLLGFLVFRLVIGLFYIRRVSFTL